MVAYHTESIKAVIAAGGLKSRSIEPLNISKAFFPLLNRPAIVHILDTLGSVGISEAFLAVGGNELEFASLPEGSNGLCVHTVLEEWPRGTAGCVKRLEERLLGHTLVVVTGNVLFFTEDDISEMLRFHRRSGAELTVGLISASRKNGMDTEKVLIGVDGQVEDISRIYPAVPRNGGPKTSGVYVMEPCVLECVGAEVFCDIKEQLVPRLRKLGKKVVGWEHGGYSSGACTVDDYLRVNFEFLSDYELAGEYLRGYREIKKQVWVGRNVDISPSATLIRPLLIGSDTRIEAGASLIGPCVIGDRCVVKAESFVRESVLWSDSVVPAGFEIEKCLVSGRASSPRNGHCRDTVVLDGVLSPLGYSGGARGEPSRSGLACSRSRGSAGEKAYLFAKRVLDVVVSSIGLVLSAPLLLLLGALIKLDSRGPAFFLQTRCGKGGKPFRMIKLRSMVSDAEDLKPALRHMNLADGPMFKVIDDPRETRLGRILRAFKLDELPQLWNVLRGEMSLVGPRPLSMNEMRFNPHWRDARLTVRPGITGLWQVKAKDAHTFHEWIKYDLQYIDERSLWLDMKIIFHTFLKVLNVKKPAVPERLPNGAASAGRT